MSRNNRHQRSWGMWGLALALCVGGAAHAQYGIPQDPVVTRPWPADTGTVHTGDSLEVTWAHTVANAHSYRLTDLISLNYAPLRDPLHAQPMDVRLTLHITATSSSDPGHFHGGANTDSLIVAVLQIGVRPHAEQDSLLSGALQDREVDELVLTGAHHLLLSIASIEVDTGAGYATVPILPKSLRIEASIAWARVCEGLDLDTPPEDLAVTRVFCGDPPDEGVPDSVVEAQTQELLFTWSTLSGMLEYQLEWTWVDDYNAAGVPWSGTLPAGVFTYDLPHNSTRITTAQTQYRIPVLYDHGYIIFRLRGVARDPGDPTVAVMTAWAGAAPAGDVHDAISAGYAIRVGAHQRGKDWQVTSSFAEEGKRKDVVAYADGTSRVRQTVTRNNSLRVPIIGETIYDVTGRPAVQIMPVPLVQGGCEDDAGAWAPITYRPHFNMRAGDQDEPEVFTAADLIALDGGCNIAAPMLHDSTGAEHYYSSAFGDDPTPLVAAPPFLPKAGGYPYSQTQYTPDNTGRVRVQGGVGAEFQLGSHATRHFYGKPEQIELDRLFGSEAGYAEHYQKNVDIDPNGQVSVTYVDMAGHAVATALTCGAPNGMDPVGSAAGRLVSDMFGGRPSTDSSLGQARTPGPELFFTNHFVVPCADHYGFHYDVTPLVIHDDCWAYGDSGLCVHCAYTLDLELVNMCGDTVFTVHALPGQIELADSAVMFACTDTVQEAAALPDSVWLDAGEYTFTKRLRVREDVRNFYLGALLDPANNRCMRTLDEIRDSLMLGIDTSACHLTCADCYAALPPRDEFIGSRRGTSADYDALLAQCDQLCTDPSWCDVAYSNMLLDVTPQGQYATYTNDDNQHHIVPDRSSVLYSGPGSSVLGLPFFNSTSTDPQRHAQASKPLWQQPLLLQNGAWTAQYLDESGNRYQVLVTPLGNDTYDPPLVANAEVDTNDNSGVIYSYPEYLVDVHDFIENWQPGFARSLVRFHPEYCYYEGCKGYGVRTDAEDRRSSSDGYDNELRHANLFAEAVDTDYYFLVDSPAGGVIEPQFLAQDPFLANPANMPFAQELIDSYNNYITVNGQSYSMPQAAAVFARCGGQFSTLPGDAWCQQFGDTASVDNHGVHLNALQMQQIHDNEWSTLRGFYLAKKYTVQKRRADAFTSSCECAGVNFCIGEEHTQPWWGKMHAPFSYTPYYWSWYGSSSYSDWYAQYMANWNAQLGHQPCQVCNDWHYQWFDDKVRRVADPGQMPGSDMSPQDAAYQNFLQTGQCPLATAWQTMFQELAMHGAFPDSTGINLGGSAGWQAIQLALNDFNATGPLPPATADVSESGGTVTISITSGSDICTVTLETPTDTAFHWSEISYVQQLNAGPGSEFTLGVYYLHNGTQQIAYINGQMCSAYSLAPCNFPRHCEPNDLALQFGTLLNMLALDGSLDATSAQALAGNSFDNGPDPDIQSAVGGAITSRFHSGFHLTWTFVPATPALYLGNSSYAGERYRLDHLTTEPADQSLADYLGQAALLQYLNSDNENYFTVELVSNGGTVLCTLRGQLWWEEAGTSTPLPLGDCGLPTPMACQGAGNQVYPDLLQVITDALLMNTPTYTDVDLWASPHMNASLASLICPTCDAEGVPDTAATGVGLTGEFDPEARTLRFGDCVEVDLSFTDEPMAFDALGAATFTGDPDENGAYHDFQADLLQDGWPIGEVAVHAPCIALVACEACPQDGPAAQSMEQQFGGDSTLLAMGLAHRDTTWALYATYQDAVDSLNQRLGLAPGDSGHVETVGYQYFRSHGFEHALPTYLRYLRHYNNAVDVQHYLRAIGSFVADYGNAVNVKEEYARYLEAVNDYNARASAAGKPPLEAVESDSAFTYGLLAEKTPGYVAFLTGHAPTSAPPQGLVQYLDGDTANGAEPCAIIYKEQYLPAYAWMKAQSTLEGARCPEFEKFTPLVSYEEFVKADLCCSDSGMALLGRYLERFYDDSLKCPGALPRLKDCLDGGEGSAQAMVAVQERGTECERLYELWQQAVTAYDTSDYYAATHISIKAGVTSYAYFEKYGYCDCAEEYLAYLQVYLEWEPGDDRLPTVLPIDRFCGGKDNCCTWYAVVVAELGQYAHSLYHDQYGFEIPFPFRDCDELRRASLCDCLPAYASYLEGYIHWNGPLSTQNPPALPEGLPQPQDIKAFCAGEQDACCTQYTDLLAADSAFQASPYGQSSSCSPGKLPQSCDDLISMRLCNCVRGYVQYLLSYTAWAPPAPKPPCPMELDRFCATPVDSTCTGAYMRYLQAIGEAQPAVSAYNAAHGTNYHFTIPDNSLFTSAYLCYCVDPYIARLQYLFSDPAHIPAAELNDFRVWDIAKQCITPEPCGPDSLQPITPEITFTEADPCVTDLLSGVTINANTLYLQQIDTLTHSITARYDSTCLRSLEHLAMALPNNEHHYTLYYYDRAGNLVRTVPPEGVHPLPITSFTDPLAQSITQDRATGQHLEFTAHQLTSDHFYNSLGQPTRSAMPDQDNMAVWDSRLTSGLPPWLVVTGSSFLPGGTGYLSGYRKVGGLSRGYVYRTADGGDTWNRCTGLVANDLYGVHCPTATEGYAVGDRGTLLRTQDGGSTWDLIHNSLLASVRPARDVCFNTTGNGLVVGLGGLVAWTGDGGGTTVLNTVAGQPDLFGAGHDGTAFTACGDLGGSGVLVPVSNSGTIGAMEAFGSTTADLTCSCVLSATEVFAAGTHGVLLKSTNGGADWTTLPTGTTDAFRAVYFATASFGVAIMDSSGTGIGVLRATTDGGQSWTAAGTPDLDLNTFTPVLGGSNELVAVGKHGQVLRLLLDWGSVGIAPVEGLPSNLDIRSAWAALDGPAERCIIGGAGEAKLRWNRDIRTLATWETSNDVLPAGEHAGAIAAAVQGTDTVNALVTTPGGARMDARWDFTAPTTVTAFGTPTAANTYDHLAQQHGDHAVAYDVAAGELRSIPLTSYPLGAATTPWSTPAGLSATDRALAVGSGDRVLLTGPAGALMTGDPADASNWNDRSTQIRPLPLRAMSRDGQYAAADQGTLYRRAGTHWEAIPTPEVRDLRGVWKAGADELVLVGQQGACYTIDPADPENSYRAIAVPQPLDLHAVITDGTAMTIGADGGSILYTADRSATPPAFTTLPFNGGDVNGLALKGGEVVAVGGGALVHRLLGSTRVPVQDVFTPGLNAIAAYAPGEVYAVGDALTARRSSDGGQHWQEVQRPAEANVPMPSLHAVCTGSGSGWTVGTAGRVASFTGTAWNAIGGSPFSTGDTYEAVARTASGAVVVAGHNGTTGRYFTRNTGSSSFTAGGSLPGHALYALWAFPPYHGVEDVLLGGNDYSGLVHFGNGSYTGTTDVPVPGTPELRALWFHDQTTGYAAGANGLLLRSDASTTVDHTTFAWNTTPQDLGDGLGGQTDTGRMQVATMGFGDRFHGFLGGYYAGVPDSTYARTVRDEGGLYGQRFWYDALGRVVLSQNTKQAECDTARFSYSLYDALGRVYEAGEVTDDRSPYFRDIFGDTVGGSFTPGVLDVHAVRTWVNAHTYGRREVTRTFYDKPLTGLSIPSFTQENLRLRVATSTFQEEYNADSLTYDQATHYSYDIHGNVKHLVQDIPQLGINGGQGPSYMNHRWKHLRYEYDLISGNVKTVRYQSGDDGMRHRYEYDADNRITKVETSADGLVWQLDAEYFYYPHGPLERVELGEHKVQGMDYAYTLQGWLKGINSDRLTPENDMGQDGVAGTANEVVGRDAFGESIGYFGDNDYSAVNTSRWDNSNGNRPFAPVGPSGTLAGAYHPLYNGNIAHTVHSLQPFGQWNSPAEQGQVLAQMYRYDQLNRLKEARGVTGLVSANTWESVTDTVADRYKSEYSYDANGNIQSAQRYDDAGLPYDSLIYHYEKNGAQLLRNRLYHLNESIDGGYGDIGTDTSAFQGDHTDVNLLNNYRYDALGNLIGDKREEIAKIEWTVSGKVKHITRTTGSTKPELWFAYGADGQRISKTVGDPANGGYKEYYIRDAQGNIMATYRYILEPVPNTNPQQYTASLKVTERPVYGSKRLGSYTRQMELYGDPAIPSYPYIQPMQAPLKHYELTDHLGNVAAVVTGRLLPGNNAGSQFQPELVSAHGYEPFGSLLPGRNYSSDAYRFGFNGMEKDDEVHGATGTSYDFGARLYDPRVGRWLSVDPLAMKNPYHSPYIGMNDNPILFADPDGMSGEVTINKESKTVTVMAVYAFYGTQSSPQIAKAYAAQIQNSFNDAHGLVTIDNVEYKVQFVIIGVDLSRFGEEAVQHVIKNNTKPMSNFIRLEPGGRTLDGASYTDHAGANTGVWSTSQVKDDVTTPAHEFNHGVNGADHPEDIDWAGGENTMDASIDMTIYSYRYVKPEYLIKDANGNYYVDVTKRKVTQGNIDAIFNEGVKKQLSKTGKAVIGDTQPANEYHK